MNCVVGRRAWGGLILIVFLYSLAQAQTPVPSPGPAPVSSGESAGPTPTPDAEPETSPAVPASHFDATNRAVLSISAESPLTVISKDKDGLGLMECFRLAAVRSDTLQINQQGIRAAQEQLAQAVAGLFPTINFVNTQNFNNTSGGGGSVTSNGIVIGGSSGGGRSYGSSTEITLSQPIFTGFSNYNSIGAASAYEENQRFTLQRSYQTLYQEVAQQFYQILSDEGDLLILDDSIRSLNVRVQELQQWVHIGRSRPSELLQAQSDLAATRVTIEQTRGLLVAAQELMAYYIGVPAEKIKLRDTQKFPSAGLLENYLTVTGSRPDILAMVQSQRQAAHNLSVAKGALLPQVTATGSYNLTNDPPRSQHDWNVALQIEVPLFDGGLIISQIRQQKALAQQSELNVQDLQRTADQGVRSAYASFVSSAAQVVRLQEQVDLDVQNYNAQADDYKRGVVTNLVVLDALDTLQTARRSLNSADINARLNLINLHVAAGIAATSLAEIPASGVAEKKTTP